MKGKVNTHAILHLFARYLLMRPLSFCAARPIKLLWKMRPYLGVLDFVLRALNKAFSAPRICKVLAGYFDRLVIEPAF